MKLNKRIMQGSVLVLSLFVFATVSYGGATFSRVKSWSAGETLTSSDLNSEFNNILNNLTPTGIDDESATTTAMQATADPYPGGVASLATSLQGEIHRIRYLIAQITGKTYWYEDPVVSLANVAPAGSLMPYAGSTAPTGWLLCYGQAVSRTTYAALFAVLSTTYGAGDGSTTFNLPDMRGRSAIGLDNLGGAAASRVAAATSLGYGAGAETIAAHTHTGPSHSHTSGTLAAETFTPTLSGLGGYVNGDAMSVGGTNYKLPYTATSIAINSIANLAVNSGSTGADGTGATSSSGGGAIMDPYLAMSYIIKY